MKTSLTQSQQFKILWEFFSKHGAEVEGRSSEELLPEQKVALSQLALGRADEATRAKLIALLRSNRNALAFLADRIKLARKRDRRSRIVPDDPENFDRI